MGKAKRKSRKSATPIAAEQILISPWVYLPFEAEMVAAQAGVVPVGSACTMRLPTPEDLIIMKAVAHRAKDLEDIQAVAASHSDLDKERIKYWVEQFGEALDLPELWKMISQLL